MSRKRKGKGRRGGISPAAAVGMLVVCSGVAFYSLRDQFGTAPMSLDNAVGALLDGADVDAGAAAEEEPGVDLLARHGSWDAKVPVRMAFANIAEAAVAAAPAGETAMPGRQWIGADPPTMRLGVLMVGEAARRAVVDGRVVGLGDKIGKALIVAIERDVLVATWGGKRLTYDLEDSHPREFRAELKRRGIDQTAGPKTGAADQIQEKEQ